MAPESDCRRPVRITTVVNNYFPPSDAYEEISENEKGIGAVYDLQAVLRSMLNQESRVREIGQTLLSLKSSSPRHCITSSKDFADIC